MAQTMREMRLLIEVQDMKPRYQYPKQQKKRMNAFVKSLSSSSGVDIMFCLKEHKIVEFILEGGQAVTKEAQKNVREFIQGEICSPEVSKKYDMPVAWLPHKGVHQVKPSHDARKEMTIENQERLQHIQSGAKQPTALTIDALEKHDLKTSGPIELRQFACGDCHTAWWRTVLRTKPVSRCKGRKCGARKYDALPREKEFGIGRFICPNPKCKRTFFGHCEAMDRLLCRKCKSLAKPHIHPKWRKKARKNKLNPEANAFQPRKPTYHQAMPLTPGDFGPEPTHGDFGPKFEPVSSFRESPVGPEAHPKFGADASDLERPLERLSLASTPGRRSSKKYIFHPSKPHDSTGSTVSTFLTQHEFESNGTEVDLDHDNEIDDHVPGACRFECSNCDNKYTVVCRMVDTAKCFACNIDNDPLGRSISNGIERKTDKKHLCSRCCTNGTCPNLQEARFAK